jgi:hypothetical protein
MFFCLAENVNLQQFCSVYVRHEEQTLPGKRMIPRTAEKISHHKFSIVKGKAIPLQAWTGP